MSDSTEYYDTNAVKFFKDTVSLDLSELYDRFLKLIPESGTVLDAGCGSGRDSKIFLARGYRVFAFDASSELAKLATDYVDIPVTVRRFIDVNEKSSYDGIWACASLLHMPLTDISESLGKLWAALKPGGAIYISFKHGQQEGYRNGRYFTAIDEDRLRVLLASLPELCNMDLWIADDVRASKNEQWLNAIFTKRVL